ncbi:translocation protein TolB [Paenibacillus sp. NPDC056579]|uniref:translocation protein TolB n=1 Tax=Paenibacillus sp. NPDC056579 TaxID=3345871 RepID=UPI00369860B6
MKQHTGEEKQLTKDGEASYPVWSYDGTWLAYFKSKDGESRELWLYETKSDRHVKVYEGGAGNVQWSPNRNIAAFLDDGVLNKTDTANLAEKPFENEAFGIGNYSWLPDGTGYLASTTAKRLPDGWTSPILYKIPLGAGTDESKMHRFFTLPSELKHGGVTVLSIGTTTFKWSADGKWIAFVVHPTASWSADSDMLCLLSSNGKTFKTLDEMLANSSWFQWAPRTSKLAYIQGGLRMALENKHLKVKELPAFRPPQLTPPGYADGNFTWQNDDSLVVQRSKESSWSQEPSERPLPVLVQVRVRSSEQKQISSPPGGFGDYSPWYGPSSEKLGWVRSDRTKASVMLGLPDGSQASVWVDSIDRGSNYYEQWDWRSVLSWYEGHR